MRNGLRCSRGVEGGQKGRELLGGNFPPFRGKVLQHRRGIILGSSTWMRKVGGSKKRYSCLEEVRGKSLEHPSKKIGTGPTGGSTQHGGGEKRLQVFGEEGRQIERRGKKAPREKERQGGPNSLRLQSFGYTYKKEYCLPKAGKKERTRAGFGEFLL